MGLLIFKWWDPFWRDDLTRAVNSLDSTKIVFEVEAGSSASTIAKALDDKGLLVSESSFLNAISDQDLETKLRSGQFVLSPNMTTEAILKALTQETGGTEALTIPEGFTLKQIDARLVKMGLIQSGDLIRCTQSCNLKNRPTSGSLEGYLFPDTYFIDKSTFQLETLTQKMLDNFNKRFDSDLESKLAASGRSLEQVVIVASLLEREVRTPQDLPLVSDIIWRRLDAGWYLGIDATLLYDDEDGALTASDLQDENDPYNTRLRKGLPPTAIGNPGLATLKAALEPEANPNWFYLTDANGTVHYAKTDAEHNQNKAQYLQ